MDARRVHGRTIRRVVLGLIVILTGWLIWGNETISTTDIDVTIPDGFEALEGFTLVHLSDLHDKSFGRNHRRLVDRVAREEPDVIAITGDLIDRDTDDFASVIELLDALTQLAPVYLVSGNHEAWNDRFDTFETQLGDTDVVWLDNQHTTLDVDGTTITLLGVADPAFCEEPQTSRCLDVWLGEAMAEQEGYVVLLSHRPELFEIYVTHGIDLVLSGHAHGGQVRIPFVGGLIAPDQGLFPLYDAGVTMEKDTTMVVSRGLGNSILPLRVNNRPELVVIRWTKTEE